MIDERSINDTETGELVRVALRELMLRFPLCGLSYFGEAVVVREDSKCKTLKTNGRIVWYGPKWIAGITPRARIFDLLHEWLHIFFNHVARRGDRKPKIWNIAADVVVVREACKLLSTPNDRWEPPKDGVIPPPWAEGMTAEQIYDEIIKNKLDVPGKENSQDFVYTEESAAASDDFRHSFTRELAQAAFVQQQITKKSPEEMWGAVVGSRLNEVLRGKEPWGRLLRGEVLNALGDEMPSYAPPSLRYFPDIIIPRMLSRTEKTLLLAIDDSGSVGETLHKEFVANVLPACMRAKKVIVCTFDAVIRECVITTRPAKILREMKFLTGAHSYTDCCPVFELVDKYKPTAVCILTDGGVKLPKKAYPKTIWVLPQNGIQQPWGRHHRMEVSW